MTTPRPCPYGAMLILKGIKVGTLESMKTLGVTLDKLFIFKGHISGQLKKAYIKCAALNNNIIINNNLLLIRCKIAFRYMMLIYDLRLDVMWTLLNK